MAGSRVAGWGSLSHDHSPARPAWDGGGMGSQITLLVFQGIRIPSSTSTPSGFLNQG